MLRFVGAAGRLRPCALRASSSLLSRALSADATSSPVRIINATEQFPGTSDFRSVNARSLCYVDRTQFLKPLMVHNAPLIFLRPRRFGKSLWLSTLKAFFEGDTEAFKGLAAHDDVIQRNEFTWAPSNPSQHNFSACPVLHFDFSTINNVESADKAERILRSLVTRAARQHGAMGEGEDAPDMLANLIQELAMREDNAWRKVVVLVDEYDALWSTFQDPELAHERKQIHDIMKRFMNVLKASSEKIEFAFLTGIAPIALTGLFSGANDLINMSLEPQYSTLLGFTQAEVERLLQARNLNFNRAKVRQMYNGYCWDPAIITNTLYNPFTIRRICETRKMMRFWVQTSNEAIVKKLNGPRPELMLPATVKEDQLTSVESVDTIGSGIVTHEGVLSFLFYGGYATIKGVEGSDFETKFTLDYPNEETKQFVRNDMLKYYGVSDALATKSADTMAKCLQQNPPDLSRFFQVLNDALSRVPGQQFRSGKYENTYQMFMFTLLFEASGCTVRAEEPNAHGFADLVISTKRPHRTFIFELKVVHDKSHDAQVNMQQRRKAATDAVDQIEQRRYESAAHANRGKRKPHVFKVAVVFSTKARQAVAAMNEHKELIEIPQTFAK